VTTLITAAKETRLIHTFEADRYILLRNFDYQ